MKTVNEYAADVKRHYIEACEAVLGRGGNVPSGMPMSDLPVAISNIPHDTTLAYHTAESTTLRTKVPSNVERYARINRIGGMTYKTDNLIPFPYQDKSKTSNGITYTVNDDGSVTVSGTATADSSFYLLTNNTRHYEIPIGKTITVSGGIAASGNYGTINIVIRKFKEDGTSSSFIGSPSDSRNSGQLAEGEAIAYFSIYVVSGDTVNGTVYPMLNYGETALPYSQYFEGFRNASVTALESEGVNLLDVSQLPNENFVDNGDGTYTLTKNGQGSARFSAYADFPNLHSAWISFTCDIIDSSEGITGAGIQAMDYEGNQVFSNQFEYRIHSSRTPAKPFRLRLYIDSERLDGDYITVKNLQINYGYLAEYPYKPYVGEIDKVEIPEAVRNLPDYGCGVEGYQNGIEWREDGKCYYVQRVKRIVCTGGEKWRVEPSPLPSGNYRLRLTLDAKCVAGETNGIGALILNHYDTVSPANTYGDIRGFAVASSGEEFLIYDPDYNTSDAITAWTAHISDLYNAGNPLIFDYALAEPIETDITDLMRDNFIAVEGDGTITAANEYGYDAETSLTYLIETAGG